jgi:hypothetical protein
MVERKGIEPEAGRVIGAGGNEKLEAIRLDGEYFRLAPSVAVHMPISWPPTNGAGSGSGFLRRSVSMRAATFS